MKRVIVSHGAAAYAVAAPFFAPARLTILKSNVIKAPLTRRPPQFRLVSRRGSRIGCE